MLDSLERARESERRFLADASHELRTPLTALRGNVAHLARYGATPALIADLEADAERLARLADDLLALSREEAAAPPRRGRPARRACLRRRRRPGRGGAGDGAGDRAALERAVSNLVDNARRHGRGAVTITVHVDGEHALLSVEDEGAGVPLLDRERVFERFYGDGRGSGSPAIVRATAERHGGRAFVEGPRFTIELVRKASESVGTLRARELRKDAREDLSHALNDPSDCFGCVILVVAAGGAFAVAATGGSGPTPAPKPLAQAIHDALAGQKPAGITANIGFTNTLFPRARWSGKQARR